MRSTKFRSWAAWPTALSVLLSLQLTTVGLMQVAGAEPVATNLHRFGVPAAGRVVVGVVQLAAVAGLWARSTRFTSALTLVAVLAGAVFLHVRGGDSIGGTLPALVTLLLTLALASARRGEGPRRRARASEVVPGAPR
jgi:DoxX-like family